MTALKMLFVRHGESEGNVEGRMEGWHSTPLTNLGRQQANRLGQHLATTGWSPTQIYCSPLLRATETLEAMIAGFKQIHPTHDLPALTLYWDDLKENNHGIFNGLTWAEARDRAPDLCHHLETCLDWQPIPQAETLVEGQQRAQGLVNDLLSRHRNGDRLWVISHHWILQQIIARLMGCDRAWGIPIGPTAVFEFWLDHRRWPDPNPNRRLNTELWKIQRFNDRSHL